MNLKDLHFLLDCGVKYKTRPGLTYHVKNTHKDKDGNLITPAPTPFSATLTGGELLHDEGVMIQGSMGGPTMVPPSMPMAPSTFTELSNSRFGNSGHSSGVIFNCVNASSSHYLLILDSKPSQFLHLLLLHRPWHGFSSTSSGWSVGPR